MCSMLQTNRVFLAICFSAFAAAFGYGALAPVLPSVLEYSCIFERRTVQCADANDQSLRQSDAVAT